MYKEEITADCMVRLDKVNKQPKAELAKSKVVKYV